MGLKYTMFFVKGDVREKLTKVGFEDITSVMQANREWETKRQEYMKSNEDNWKKNPESWLEYILKLPEETQLRNYIEDMRDPVINYFSVWGMEWNGLTVGIFTHYGAHPHTSFIESLNQNFHKAGIDEWFLLMYAHGSDSGDILRFTWNECHHYKMLNSETERFWRYVKRVSKYVRKKYGEEFDFEKWHEKMCELKSNIDWDWEVRLLVLDTRKR